MPGQIPGIPGVIAFAGVKFGGYYLAGMTLRKWIPAMEASALKIAGWRTGLGIAIGLPLTFGLVGIVTDANPSSTSSWPLVGVYGFVLALRILIWAGLIHTFARETGLRKAMLWSYAVLGGAWSSFLDVAGIAFAFITPGQVPFC